MPCDRPSDLHSDLTDERLEDVCGVLCAVRTKVLKELQRDEGDDRRVFGYTSFVRACYAVGKAAVDRPWLRVIGTGKGEHFVLRVGAVPIRFYSGNPTAPDERWLAREDDELTAHQSAFGLLGPSTRNWMLRLTLETDFSSGMTSVMLVRFAENGDLIDSWPIRVSAENSTPPQTGNAVLALAEQHPGRDIRPPNVEDLADTQARPATAHGDD